MNYFSNNLESNKAKIFFQIFSERRNFIPLLSVYFLTIPNTHANMLGIFTWIWFIAWFLFEIPSSYLADTFWYKKTLILAKLSLLLSTISFILWSYIGNAFFMFILWSIFMSLAFSLNSWTISAFFYDTLTELKQEKDFTKIFWKIKANVSLLSVIFIILLPFFTKISILVPFYIALFIDILWFINTFFLVSPKKEKVLEKIEKSSIFKIIKDSYDIWFLPFAVFFWAISWIWVIWSNAFRVPYLEDLWYPIVLIWFVMWISRVVWFIVWHYIHYLEKFLNIKKFLIFEILINCGLWFLIIIFDNPYLVWFIISIMIWYFWWRQSLVENIIFKNYVKNKNYKATILSIKSQINLLFSLVTSFWITYFIWISYKLWFSILLIFLSIVLIISFLFIKKR